MSSERTDKYWTRIKISISVPLAMFALLVIIVIIQDPTGSEEVTYSTYPITNAVLWLWAFSLLFGVLLLWHSLYRDKQELSKDFSDVKRRHWITIGIFSYFTFGIYPLWYLLARYEITKRKTESSSIVEEPDKAGSAQDDTEVKKKYQETTTSQDKHEGRSQSASSEQISEVPVPPKTSDEAQSENRETESSSETTPTPDISEIELCVSVYPEPMVVEDRWFGVLDQTIAEHDKDVRNGSLLGTETVERVFECSPSKIVIAGKDRLRVGEEVIEYSNVLNCRLKIGRSLATDSQQEFQLHDCDYIGLTIAERELGDAESPADYEGKVSHLYLIGSISEIESRSGTTDETNTITNTPSISESELKTLYKNISSNMSDSVSEAYVLQEYIEIPANLIVENWSQSSVATAKQSAENDMNVSGILTDGTLAPYRSPDLDSSSTVIVEVSDDLDDSSFVSEINFLQVSDDEIFIDSDPTLWFDYSTIDRVHDAEKGFILEADGTTYEIRGAELSGERGGYLSLDWVADPRRRDRQRNLLEKTIALIKQRVSESAE